MNILTRDEMASHEATCDPIFLFQYKRYILKEIPVEYHYNDDGDIIKDGTEDFENPEVLSWAELEDMECAIHVWETEDVFYSREEGEEYGHRRHYNYTDGWRVYCVCAQGKLAEILKKYGDKETVYNNSEPHPF